MYRRLLVALATVTALFSTVAQAQAPPVSSYIAPWVIIGNVAALTASGSTSNVELGWVTATPKQPAPLLAFVCNTGSNAAYVNFGGSGVTATSNNAQVAAGFCRPFGLNGATYMAGLAVSSTTTLTVETGNGTPLAQAGSSGGGGGGGVTIQTATVEITSAQLLNCATSPITIVAAPGSGKIIVPVAIIDNFKYVSAPYTTDGSDAVYYGSASGLGAAIANPSINGLASSQITMEVLNINTPVAPTELINQAVVFTDTTNPTGGDGMLGISFSYIVVTAP